MRIFVNNILRYEIQKTNIVTQSSESYFNAG